jgi:SAM-dependent methyltransferase
MNPSELHLFLERVDDACARGALVRLTLGGYRGSERELRELVVRPVRIKAGPRLSFVYRYRTRDITRNHAVDEGLRQVHALLGATFRRAALHATDGSAQLERADDGSARLHTGPPAIGRAPDLDHDRAKARPVAASAPWLAALGIARPDGRIRADGMDKFRQINRFVELLAPLLDGAGLRQPAIRLVDMGCGKGCLTFAAFDHLHRAGWTRADVRGIERRAELVEAGNRVARETGREGLAFAAGGIADAPLAGADIVVALHACDTATDDALARGVAAGAAVILAAPCCHKELRPRLRAPAALSPLLKHGILREREAAAVTDALRAALLEWAGYRTQVFEFIALEHTARNVMIAAVKRPHPTHKDTAARRAREFAAFYGITAQRLAQLLGFALGTTASPSNVLAVSGNQIL